MEKLLTITVMGKEQKVQPRTTYEELAEGYKERFRSEIVLARCDNEYRELCMPVKEGENITFLDLTFLDGMRVYHRSVSFLTVKAVKDVLGVDADIVIENSINKNFYCEFRTGAIAAEQALLNRIQARMEALVKADLPFVKSAWKREDAVRLLQGVGLRDKARLLHYRRASNVNLYCLDNFYDYFYGYMAPSTGYLKKFRLEKYENGFLIVFPTMENPETLPEPAPLEKIFSVFMEQKDWCHLMRVKTVADLNDCIVNGNFGDLVRINEALHEKKIAQIADKILEKIKDVRLVLIAGPSSSGKTTFAQRLCVQLRVNGIIPHVISLDNYFLDRDQTPVDAYGKHDFENIDALDLKQFNADLNRLIAGETVEIPYFNFVSGQREYKGDKMRLLPGEIFVIEGIHGLNPKLTSAVPDINKFEIYISAMTQLNVDVHNSISTADSRLIRRIVRDHQFRGNSAVDTINTWPYVTRGEANNIFPFQENADVMFNSATIYELSVLKVFAEPLLFQIDKSMPEYPSAKRLIKFLDYFLPVGTENLPNNSIMREFVGGSCFRV